MVARIALQRVKRLVTKKLIIAHHVHVSRKLIIVLRFSCSISGFGPKVLFTRGNFLLIPPNPRAHAKVGDGENRELRNATPGDRNAAVRAPVSPLCGSAPASPRHHSA